MLNTFDIEFHDNVFWDGITRTKSYNQVYGVEEAEIYSQIIYMDLNFDVCIKFITDAFSERS